MIGAFFSAWTLLKHRSVTLPALATIVASSTISVVLMMLPATPSASTWLAGPLPVLSNVNQTRVLSVIVSQQCVSVGVIMATLAVLHVSRQLSSGFIRVELAAQPRRGRWLTGTWGALATAAVVASAFATVTVVVAGYIYAAGQGINSADWTHGVGSALKAFISLCLATIGFTFAGGTLGLWLRSPAPALVVAFAYTALETTITAVSPIGRGLLPISAIRALATPDFDAAIHMPSTVAAIVFTLALATCAFGLITSRNVTD